MATGSAHPSPDGGRRMIIGASGRSDDHAAPTPLPGRPVRGPDSGRPIMALLDLLGRRWALRVIWELSQAPAPTFRELQRRCGGVSSSVLTQRIAELTEAAIVRRADRGYTLTADGLELRENLSRLDGWAKCWADRTGHHP